MGNPREGSSPFARTIPVRVLPGPCGWDARRSMGAREKRRITLAVPAVFRKYNEISLIKRILVGLAIGIVLALLIPNV